MLGSSWVVRVSRLELVPYFLISPNSCTVVFFQAFDRESSDRDMVGRPVLALEIGTLFADFAEFLVLCTIGAVFERESRFVFGTSVP